jgi:hypothetical protein
MHFTVTGFSRSNKRNVEQQKIFTTRAAVPLLSFLPEYIVTFVPLSKNVFPPFCCSASQQLEQSFAGMYE